MREVKTLNEFGELLRNLRGKRSLREMERLTELSHTYLSTLEKGIDPRSGKERKPSPDVLKRLAKGLSNEDEKEFNAIYNTFMISAGYANAITYDDFNNRLSFFTLRLEEVLKQKNLCKQYLEEAVKNNDIEKMNSLKDAICTLEENEKNIRYEIEELNKIKKYGALVEATPKIKDKIILNDILKSDTPVEINGKLLSSDEKEKLLKTATTMFSDNNE